MSALTDATIIVGFEIGVLVGGVRDFRTAGEERVGLVEEEHGVVVACVAEDGRQALGAVPLPLEAAAP